eukprot:SAG11_NODE_569_length_8458_cov_5.574231_8_plen_51_part_00
MLQRGRPCDFSLLLRPRRGCARAVQHPAVQATDWSGLRIHHSNSDTCCTY